MPRGRYEVSGEITITVYADDAEAAVSRAARRASNLMNGFIVVQLREIGHETRRADLADAPNVDEEEDDHG